MQRVIVGFGDVKGFGQWAHRSSTSQEEFKKFILSAHDVYIELRRKGYFVKLLADGVMFIKELPSNKFAPMICRGSLFDAWHLNQQISELIKKMPHPRPLGYRVRLAKGDVLKLTSSVGEDKFIETDYVGYIINLAFRLLNVEKDVPCICHESLREQINGKSIKLDEFKLTKIDKLIEHVEGIDDEDLRELWAYQCSSEYLINLSNLAKQRDFVSPVDSNKRDTKKKNWRRYR